MRRAQLSLEVHLVFVFVFIALVLLGLYLRIGIPVGLIAFLPERCELPGFLCREVSASSERMDIDVENALGYPVRLERMNATSEDAVCVFAPAVLPPDQRVVLSSNCTALQPGPRQFRVQYTYRDMRTDILFPLQGEIRARVES